MKEPNKYLIKSINEQFLELHSTHPYYEVQRKQKTKRFPSKHKKAKIRWLEK